MYLVTWKKKHLSNLSEALKKYFILYVLYSFARSFSMPFIWASRPPHGAGYGGHHTPSPTRVTISGDEWGQVQRWVPSTGCSSCSRGRGHTLGLLSSRDTGVGGPWSPATVELSLSSLSHWASKERNIHPLKTGWQLTEGMGDTHPRWEPRGVRSPQHRPVLGTHLCTCPHSTPLFTTQTSCFANGNGFFHILLIRLYEIEPSFEESGASLWTGLSALVTSLPGRRRGLSTHPRRHVLHALVQGGLLRLHSALSALLGDMLVTHSEGPRGHVPSFGSFSGLSLSFLAQLPKPSGITWSLWRVSITYVPPRDTGIHLSKRVHCLFSLSNSQFLFSTVHILHPKCVSTNDDHGPSRPASLRAQS